MANREKNFTFTSAISRFSTGLFTFLALYFFLTNCYAASVAMYDFGRIKEGRVLKHNFILKNESAKILNILSVNTSCGCTVSKVKKAKLFPGEKTIVEAKFETKGYSGIVLQQVYLQTDDPKNQILTFTLKADVIAQKMPDEKK